MSYRERTPARSSSGCCGSRTGPEGSAQADGHRSRPLRPRLAGVLGPPRRGAPLGGGDFVELIAKKLPLWTISDMIGVPEADRERVVRAADTLVTVSDPEIAGDRSPLEALGAALWTLTEFATELAAFRERNPGDDLMTGLVQAEIDGDRLTHAEIGAFFVLLSAAGTATTRHTTSHATP